MATITNSIAEDGSGKPGIGVYDPSSHTMVTAQAGTVSTDATTGIQYAPVATSGGSGSSDVAIHDNGTPANHLAIDAAGKIGVNNFPATQTVSGSVQLLDSGGTNKAAIDAAGNVATKGGFTEQASLSAGSLNADLVASVDVSAYKWFSIHTSGTWSGLFTFQCSNDNVNFVSFSAFQASSSFNFNSTFTTNNLFHSPIFFRYLRIRMTSYTSGTANGTLELYTSDAMAWVSAIGLNSGTATIGAINNDGVSNTAITAGTTSNTVVKGSSGRLASILVTSAGTNALNVYDNASTASGTIIALIPANSAAGTFTMLKVPASNGITVAGSSNNPGVTIFYT